MKHCHSHLKAVIKDFHMNVVSLSVNTTSRCYSVSPIYPRGETIHLQVLLEMCRPEQMTDVETIEMHLERIKALMSEWATQVGPLAA